MFLKKMMKESTKDYLEQINDIVKNLEKADAVLIGIGAGLSASAGLTYYGERFDNYFSDFKEKYGIEDMYSGGFYPFATKEEYWAWWSRHIFINRYEAPVGQPYIDLLDIVKHKDYFILSTNVDHQVQKAGFDKKRLFYTQGDYGLMQCSVSCHYTNYDNKDLIYQMVESEKEMKIPSNLIPTCPRCGAPMTNNLRIDNRFVEDEGWHKAQKRYSEFLEENSKKAIIYLELGVGMNTPGIIKYPFMKMTYANPKATFITLNQETFKYPDELSNQLIQLDGDIGKNLQAIRQRVESKSISN
ncbi:Sir2 silent information regulator family NAD-dependent deacetylase [Streptococcus mitis]|uniref:SIR2 family NAD-dependent protein deacylase n=1 Tax=Streptococcus mitis TaxID=28037 RepID=UPI0039C242FC